MSHALVIGGTGMLRGAAVNLCKTFKTVSVTGRNKHRLYSLQRESEHLKGNTIPIIVDYTSEKELLFSIEEAVKNYGNISLVVSWIHSTAPRVAFKIAELISSYGQEFRFFDILGCEYKNPAANNTEREKIFRQVPFIKYRKIILGFIRENEISRWLTNEEISSGTTKAIENDSEEYVIGTVTPWELHPRF